MLACEVCGRRVRYRGRPIAFECRGDEKKRRQQLVKRLETRLHKLSDDGIAVSRAMARVRVCLGCDQRFPRDSQFALLGCRRIGTGCKHKRRWTAAMLADSPEWPDVCPQRTAADDEESENMNPLDIARVVCVNLDRRPGRWTRFLQSIPRDWPFRSVERFEAVDGKACSLPDGWVQPRRSAGAWGCYRSHLRILEECLSRDVKSVLVFEDDATFEPDFAARCAAFLRDVPDDWGMIYFGGQHLGAKTRPPQLVAGECYRSFNVNRTHAYAIRGGQAMRDVYRHLSDIAYFRQHPRHHIDHALGALHGSGQIKAYAPAAWLVHQEPSAGSDVAGSHRAARWPGARELAEAAARRAQHVTANLVVPRPVSSESPSPKQPPPVVVVVGLHRSGSSCLAGVLAKLGVHFGHKFVGCEPDGGHESADVARFCEHAMRYPGTRLAWSWDRIARTLLGLIGARRSEAPGRAVGIKYPHLCALARPLVEAMADRILIVHASRPLDESIASLIRRDGKRKPHEQLASVQRWLWDRKAELLATPGLRVLTVEYDDLIHDTAGQVSQLVEFLGVDPPAAAIAEAVGYVDPGRRHIAPAANPAQQSLPV